MFNKFQSLRKTITQKQHPRSMSKLRSPKPEELDPLANMPEKVRELTPEDRALFIKGLPADDLKTFIKTINKLITEYNDKTKESSKIEILKKIQQQVKKFEAHYKGSDLAHSPYYLAAQAQIFKEIQYQYASLERTPESHSSPLAELIATMSPAKTDELLVILIEGGKANLNQLETLYSSKDNSQEARNFREFLAKHDIEFLGGGNSQNFKVTPTSGGKSEVIKIDNRLDAPKSAEMHLRDKLGNNFIPMHAERPATSPSILGRREFEYRTVLVTEYCQNGSIFDHRNNLAKNQDNSEDQNQKLAENTQMIFKQMAKSMLDIQKAGCMFVDSKNSNWLLDENKQIRIADTKSFVFLDQNGLYDEKLPENKYYSMKFTRDYDPPELNKSRMSADAVHAYILGKNLYAYITNKVGGGDNGADFDFNMPFFETAQGKEYKELIINLVKPDPNQRLSVTKALDKLTIINHPDQILIERLSKADPFILSLSQNQVMDNLLRVRHPEYESIFKQLEHLQFGNEDKVLNQFILDKKEQLRNTTNPEQVNKIFDELKNTAQVLNNGAIQEVRTIITDLKARSGVFNMGIKEKAHRIEQEMSNLSIEERCNFSAIKQPEKVMRAIASHRHWGKTNKVYLTETGEIDEKKGTRSYKDFKSRLQSLVTPKEQENKEEIQSSKSTIKPN
jgi:hypothetical protein